MCNPLYASRILSDDDDKRVTAFMPLGIGVYEDGDGKVYVSELNVALLGMMFGGTIAHYARQGVHVSLVCATKGEAGEISDPALATPDGLLTSSELRMPSPTARPLHNCMPNRT